MLNAQIDATKLKYLFNETISFDKDYTIRRFTISDYDNSLVYFKQGIWNLDTMFGGLSLAYSNRFGEVIFQSGKIIYNSNITDQSKEIECIPMIFEIMYDVNNNINKMNCERTNQLERRVLFYEKYFGKLEGDMNDDCVQWIPVVKQPEFDPCIETKD